MWRLAMTTYLLYNRKATSATLWSNFTRATDGQIRKRWLISKENYLMTTPPAPLLPTNVPRL